MRDLERDQANVTQAMMAARAMKRNGSISSPVNFKEGVVGAGHRSR
jgi:hypothetical protein